MRLERAQSYAREDVAPTTTTDGRRVNGGRYEHEEEQSFDINLSILLECLNIFGGDCTSMRMCYAGHGNPLVL